MLNHVLNPEHHVPSYHVRGHKQQQLLVVHAQPLDAENMVSRFFCLKTVVLIYEASSVIFIHCHLVASVASVSSSSISYSRRISLIKTLDLDMIKLPDSTCP